MHDTPFLLQTIA